MHGQNLTTGPIPKQLWSLAWPMMLSMFFYTLYNLVDAFWVAKLSPDAIAAVSISQITLFIMISLAMGISIGSAVLMGMKMGAGDKAEAERVLGQGYVLAGLVGIFFTALALCFRAQFLTFSGAVGDIFPLALPYFTITAAGSILTFLMMMTSTAFNAQGDNFTPTKLFALSTSVNTILDPLFIFGYGAIPAMGISGAAYATLVSQAIFLALALWVLSGEQMMVRLRLANLRLRWESVKKVFDIGIPASLTQTLNPLGFAVMMSIVSATFLEAGAAAFSIGFRIEFFAFIPAIGFGFASMAMMGQNIGAGNRQRAKAVFNKAVLYGAGAAFAFGALAFVFAPFIVKTFTHDHTVTNYALQYFRIVPFGYAFFAVAFIEANVFQGLGRSWPGFWITLGRVGATVLLTNISVSQFALPIWSVWTSIALGGVVASITGLAWVRYVITHIKLKIPIEHTSAEEPVSAPVV
jgi:putative MATE family efflux protein